MRLRIARFALWRTKAVLAAAACYAFWGGAVLAAPPAELLRALGVPVRAKDLNDTGRIQTDLAWVGIYQGQVTAVIDRATQDAIRRFQASMSTEQTGRLTAEGRSGLRQRAEETRAGYGFGRKEIDWLGIRTVLPEALLLRPELSGDDFNTVTYQSHHGAFLNFRFDVFPSMSHSPKDVERSLRKLLSEGDTPLEVQASRSFASSLYLIAIDDAERRILIGERDGGGWRLMTVSHAVGATDAMRPVLHEIFRSLELSYGPILRKSERQRRIKNGEYPGAKALPKWYLTMIASGSGSLVSRQGHILTNHHVISECEWVTVNGRPATVVGSDVRLDLALLISPNAAGKAPVRFRKDNPQLGEAVNVMGYPVFQTSQSMNYTRGYVSSVVGYKGNRNTVQITAPVQPGNSGGPVLDDQGRQIAVVVAKPSVRFQASANIENMAWVIRGRQALGFLRRHGVSPIVEDRAAGSYSPDVEDVSRWRLITVRIECHEN